MNSAAAVIPFCKGEAFIGKCIDSLLASGLPAEHVYIVDNGPTETAAGFWKAVNPELRVIRTPPRLGFGRACNIGAAAAIQGGAQYLLITNQDTILDPGCLRLLVRGFQENPAVSILAPLNYAYGFETMEETYISHFLSQNPRLIVDAFDRGCKGIYEVEKIVGSCFLISTEAIRELGLFDELYFMYSEDEDLCRRYRLAERHLALLPTARMGHAHSLTSTDNQDQIKLWTRQSRLLFILKNIRQPFWRCAARAAFEAAPDYLRCAAKLDLRMLWRFAKGDLRELCRLGAILRGRSQERNVVERHRETSPKQSRCGARAISPVFAQKS